MEYCVKSTINTRGIVPIFINYFFCAVQSTKHLVDWVSADHIDYYMQGSSKWDKYGFFYCLPEKVFMWLDVFSNFSKTIYHFKLILLPNYNFNG